MKWKKGFLKEKVSKANWLSLFAEPCSPAGTTYCVYICVCSAEWKTWCYFERAEKSLSIMSGRAVKRDVMNVNQMMRILSRNFWGFVCVSFADYFPTALRNQADIPRDEDDDGDEEDTSTVQPHTGSTTAKSNTSQNGKSSLRYYVITSSPANMPGQWHEPGWTAGHSTSMCPVLFITLHFCSSYSISVY